MNDRLKLDDLVIIGNDSQQVLARFSHYVEINNKEFCTVFRSGTCSKTVDSYYGKADQFITYDTKSVHKFNKELEA